MSHTICLELRSHRHQTKPNKDTERTHKKPQDDSKHGNNTNPYTLSPFGSETPKRAKSDATTPGDGKMKISNITSLHLHRGSKTARHRSRSKGNADESIPPLQ